MHDEYEDNPVTSVPDKTFDNRDLGIEKLENVDIGIVTRPTPGSDGHKRWGGDPYLTFSEPVAVRHGGHELKVVGASFFTKTDKMTAASLGIPAARSLSVEPVRPRTSRRATASTTLWVRSTTSP